MDGFWTIIVSASTGGLVTILTTSFSSFISNKKERKRWESETAIKFIDYSLSKPELARKVARQFSVAVVVHLDTDDSTIDKYFLPAFCRFSVGRLPDHDISIPDPYLSRDQGLFFYDRGGIYFKDTSPSNKTTINNKVLKGRKRLKAGDILCMGHTYLKFECL